MLALVMYSCNPYEQYSCTHYYIQVELDPGSAQFSANVQMVYLTGKPYTDSICFYLNRDVEIHTLAAQELQHYRFERGDTGLLILYIEDPVSANEQLHISLSYSGRINKQEVLHLDSSHFWYPVNEDTPPSTFQAKFALPGEWQISHPPASTGKHGKRLIETRKPQNSLNIIFTRDQP